MSLQSRFRKPKQQEPVLVKPSGNGNGESLLLSLKQTAVYIGLPIRQIRSLVTAGILKTVPTQTKAFYVARIECDRYVRDLIKATDTAKRTEPLRKKRHFKIRIPKRPRFQSARFLAMTDAQVQEFFRNAVIDEDGVMLSNDLEEE